MAARITSLFALWTVLGSLWAWFLPEHFVWVTDGSVRPLGQSLIAVLLGLVMLGMGLTLSVADFRRVFELPRRVALGVALQFTVMPLTGAALAYGMGLEPGLAVGLILVACCPGGTASNVVTYLVRGNLALSVTMTMASTLLAIAFTPLLTGWLAGYLLEIDRGALFREMIAIVLLPIVIGVALNRFLPQFAGPVGRWSPLVSVFAVVLIVAAIIAASKPLIQQHFGVLMLAVFLLHVSGFGLGFIVSRIAGLDSVDARTISVEVGMQNSGLGASLASGPAFAAQFASMQQAALAPVPSAISSINHVVLGSLLAPLMAWLDRRAGRLREETGPADAP